MKKVQNWVRHKQGTVWNLNTGMQTWRYFTDWVWVTYFAAFPSFFFPAKWVRTSQLLVLNYVRILFSNSLEVGEGEGGTHGGSVMLRHGVGVKRRKWRDREKMCEKSEEEVSGALWFLLGLQPEFTTLIGFGLGLDLINHRIRFCLDLIHNLKAWVDPINAPSTGEYS